jgi:hypothetical protein
VRLEAFVYFPGSNFNQGQLHDQAENHSQSYALSSPLLFNHRKIFKYTNFQYIATQHLNMAPTRSKKQRKSTESAGSVDVQQSQIVATKTRSPARTPSNRSPIKKVRMGITVGQKQALIDNLQLESKCPNEQKCAR